MVSLKRSNCFSNVWESANCYMLAITHILTGNSLYLPLLRLLLCLFSLILVLGWLLANGYLGIPLRAQDIGSLIQKKKIIWKDLLFHWIYWAIRGKATSTCLSNRNKELMKVELSVKGIQPIPPMSKKYVHEFQFDNWGIDWMLKWG